MSKKKPSKTPPPKKKKQTTVVSKGASGMSAKSFSKKRAESKVMKGASVSKARGKAISGRTRIGEVPDALNIYKGEG